MEKPVTVEVVKHCATTEPPVLLPHQSWTKCMTNMVCLDAASGNIHADNDERLLKWIYATWANCKETTSADPH